MNHSPTEGAQGSANSKTPENMPIDELLELYQQISSRVAMYNTEILIDRMFELRGILNQRFSNLSAQLAQSEERVAKLTQSVQELSELLRYDGRGHVLNAVDRARALLSSSKKMKNDYAIQRHPEGKPLSKEWFYSIDGRPECNAIAAMHYLKAAGLSTEDAWKYLRELCGPAKTMSMPAEEERHFDSPYSP